MTSPENENPYQSPSVKESSTDQGAEVWGQVTAFENVLVFLVALVVAIPVFAATCAGGSFALLAFDMVASADHQPWHRNGIFFVFIGSLVLAAFVGGRIGRLSLRRRRSKKHSLGTTNEMPRPHDS